MPAYWIFFSYVGIRWLKRYSVTGPFVKTTGLINPYHAEPFYVHALHSSPKFDSIDLQYFSCQAKWKYSSVKLDQLAFKKSTDLDLHCFQNRICPDSSWYNAMQ